MPTLGPLGAQLRQIAWSKASTMYPGVQPADPEDYEKTRTERLAGCLALLRVYTDMIKTLNKQIDLTIKEARHLDATYGDIAAACRVSRQAARQAGSGTVTNTSIQRFASPVVPVMASGEDQRRATRSFSTSGMLAPPAHQGMHDTFQATKTQPSTSSPSNWTTTGTPSAVRHGGYGLVMDGYRPRRAAALSIHRPPSSM